MLHNVAATLATFAASLAWLRLLDFTAHRGWISSKLSRKIIHIGTGPLFVLCWLIFPHQFPARYLAALIPLTITLQFTLVGLGVIKDQSAVDAMSRTGDRREILRGPLFYGIVFVVLTAVYWIDSPTGIIALMLVCGGDGMADIIGRRFGRKKLPWNKNKSWIGSIAFFLGGWFLTIAILAVYSAAGVFQQPWGTFFAPVSAIALAATLVESVSPADSDNITIAISAAALGSVLF